MLGRTYPGSALLFTAALCLLPAQHALAEEPLFPSFNCATAENTAFFGLQSRTVKAAEALHAGTNAAGGYNAIDDGSSRKHGKAYCRVVIDYLKAEKAELDFMSAHRKCFDPADLEASASRLSDFDSDIEKCAGWRER